MTSLNRAQGATNAGNKEWADQQLQAAQQYVLQFSTLYKQQPLLLTNLQTSLQEGGFPTITISQTDVSNLQDQLANSGLPTWYVQALTDLEVSTSDQRIIQGLMFTLDANSVVSLGGGNYPQMLTDPNLFKTIQDTVQGLNQGLIGVPRKVYLPLIIRGIGVVE